MRSMLAGRRVGRQLKLDTAVSLLCLKHSEISEAFAAASEYVYVTII